MATLSARNAFAAGPKMSGNANVAEKPLVCVVDDDSLIRDSTLRLLRSFGFRVEAFASAEEFVGSKYFGATASLILDVRMSGMTGIELQQQLASHPRKIPVIFITAYEDKGMREQAMSEGATAFLLKPFSEESLLSAIDAALTSQANVKRNPRND